MDQDPQQPDVVFVSYDEPNADDNYRRLQQFRPAAKRVHGVRGIYHAYRAAAELAGSPYFFMVDGDNWVLDDFDFSLTGLRPGAEVYLWAARNAVNGILGGAGSLKLINRQAVCSMDENAVDFFTSMTAPKVLVKRLASETRFNASPFLAWRAGFRECAKLASAESHPVSAEHLRIWQTVGAEKPNGIWCLLGARMGAAFGAGHRGSDELRRIHDLAWLRAVFERLGRASGPLEISPAGG